MVFFVVIFLTKNETVYKNAYQENGLVYSGTEKVGDLVNRDTDGDGVSDWQEGLFGTSPTKKDTNDDGIPDNVEIAKISGKIPKNGELNLNNLENIDTTTNTEQLSREIFSTVATLTQTGIIDQNTIDKLSQSLANKIESSSEQKMLTLNDLKITKTDTLQDVKNYSDALNKINNKYPNPGTSVLKTIDKFIVDEDTVDDSALLDMDKIVKYIDNLINEMKNVETPPSLAPLHLNVLNTMQKITENLNTIKLYESDPLSAMNGVSQYGSNMVILESGLDKLINAIEERL